MYGTPNNTPDGIYTAGVLGYLGLTIIYISHEYLRVSDCPPFIINNLTIIYYKYIKYY
jgi:hypothetical protein